MAIRTKVIAAAAALLALIGAQSTTAQDIYGEWNGRWGGGGGKIGITIINSGDATPGVTYCFKKNCWEPADVALDGTVLTFTAPSNLSYRFELHGDRLRAKLKKGGRTFRTKMKRVADGTVSAKRTTQEAGK